MLTLNETTARIALGAVGQIGGKHTCKSVADLPCVMCELEAFVEFYRGMKNDHVTKATAMVRMVPWGKP